MGVPRLLGWLLFTFIFLLLALWLQATWPGSVIAVTAYKAHLMALGGWGGYWLDRALFPYARPDRFIDSLVVDKSNPDRIGVWETSAAAATIRRAIIVAACLICVGLGA